MEPYGSRFTRPALVHRRCGLLLFVQLPTYHRPMNSKQFATLAAEFETLQKELRRTNDPPTRKALLTEIRAKLQEIQRAAKVIRKELCGN